MPSQNVAEEVASCLNELTLASELAFYYEGAEGADARAGKDLIEARWKFHGPTREEPPDQIEERLRSALAMLDAALRPHLAPQAV